MPLKEMQNKCKDAKKYKDMQDYKEAYDNFK